MKSRLWRSAAAAAVVGLASSELFTPKHEAGRCAIRGSCGGGSFFSPALPCPDNGLAEDPEVDVRKKLVDLCGPKWSTGPVCCLEDQVCTMEDERRALLKLRRSIRSLKTSTKRKTSYQLAPHARRTSTTYSAHLPAPRTSRCSST